MWSNISRNGNSTKHLKAHKIMERPNKCIRQAINEKNQINRSTLSRRSNSKNG